MQINHFITDIFSKIGKSLIEQKNDLKIEPKSDRYGNSYWQVYDFTTNQYHAFGSEQDVRAWIENRYHSF